MKRPASSSAFNLPLLLTALVFAGCTTARAPVDPSTTRVGPAGGEIASVGGELTLRIPTGALGSEREISVRALPEMKLPAGSIAGTAFELGPDGLTFEKPVEISIAYAAGALAGDNEWLRVVQVLPDGKIAPTEHVAHLVADGRVVAKITHFSRYALANLELAKATISTTLVPVTDVDVLFVVDNSGSMGEEQGSLAQSFPLFAQRLEQAGLSFRIGVTSPDLGAGPYGLPSCEVAGGDNGKLQNTARVVGCTPPLDPWIEKKANGPSNVPGGDVGAAFSCIARLGTTGCGFEQPLEAAHRALDGKVNAGFVRPGAALAVIYVTDEDDCSAKNTALFDPSNASLGPLTSFRCFEHGVTCDSKDPRLPGPRKACKPAASPYFHDVSRYVGQLKALKPNGAVVVAAIAGPRGPVSVGQDGNNPTLEPSCQSSSGLAVPPVRLASFIDSFGSRGVLKSICDGNYASALDALGALVAKQTQVSWCLPYDPVDTAPLTPGLQPDCLVVASKAGPLPPCKQGQTSACYSIEHGKTCGKSSTQIHVENADAASIGSEVFAICLAP